MKNTNMYVELPDYAGCKLLPVTLKSCFSASYNKIIHKVTEHLQILTGYHSYRMAGEEGVINNLRSLFFAFGELETGTWQLAGK